MRLPNFRRYASMTLTGRVIGGEAELLLTLDEHNPLYRRDMRGLVLDEVRKVAPDIRWYRWPMVVVRALQAYRRLLTGRLV
jgi:hypothetical protein